MVDGRDELNNIVWKVWWNDLCVGNIAEPMNENFSWVEPHTLKTSKGVKGSFSICVVAIST